LENFSVYLGVSRSTLSKYMNGESQPGGKEFIELIADKLGPEIYDLMDMPRPDPNLVYIIKHWGALDDTMRLAIREQTEKYTRSNGSSSGAGG
jgi:transcriptional regulator with XRE-family HTH domain